MDKIGFIDNITRKLVNNEKLNTAEINAVRSALNESTNNLQKPYYEVTYHDQYDNTETRIMEPIYSKKVDNMDDGYHIQEDYFELRFRRIVKEE